MAEKIFESHRIISPLSVTSINNSNTAGSYAYIKRATAILAVLSTGAMAATKTVKLEILQAKDALGTDAEALSANALITANTKVKKATVALASTDAGDTVTVTSYANDEELSTETFTQGEATSVATKVFSNAAGLVSCINGHIEGVIASASSTNVIVTANEGHTATIASTGVGGAITVATNEALAVVEINSGSLSDGFNYIAPKVTTTANGYSNVVFLLRMKDLPASQGNVGASN